MVCELSVEDKWVLGLDGGSRPLDSTWPFLKFHMRHGGLATRQEALHVTIIVTSHATRAFLTIDNGHGNSLAT